MLIHWIWLAERKGVSDRRKVELLERFSDPEQLFFTSREELAAFGLSDAELESLCDHSLDGPRAILDDCGDFGLSVMTIRDGIYPNRLKNIPDPPVVLYYRGRVPPLDERPTIGVVGTRKASLYGLNSARRLGYQIAAQGGIVVSGLAEGIDAMAMQGALTAGGTVVGILGCGAEQIYPRRNRALFADTVRYGCILSPFAPGSPPKGYHFPIRNRLISGVSDGVLVVEAPEKSGALITAARAAEQGRDVFVVPGNIDVASARGSNALLRDGGIPVSCGWDVLCEYEARYPGVITPKPTGAKLRPIPGDSDAPPLQVAQKPKKIGEKSRQKPPKMKKVIDNGKNEPYIDCTKIPGLTAQEQTILSLLTDGPKMVDDLMAESALRAAQVNSSLTLLELKGLIRRLPGKQIQLTGRK